MEGKNPDWVYLFWPVWFILGTWILVGRVVVGLIDQIDKKMNWWDKKGSGIV